MLPGEGWPSVLFLLVAFVIASTHASVIVSFDTGLQVTEELLNGPEEEISDVSLLAQSLLSINRDKNESELASDTKDAKPIFEDMELPNCVDAIYFERSAWMMDDEAVNKKMSKIDESEVEVETIIEDKITIDEGNEKTNRISDEEASKKGANEVQSNEGKGEEECTGTTEWHKLFIETWDLCVDESTLATMEAFLNKTAMPVDCHDCFTYYMEDTC